MVAGMARDFWQYLKAVLAKWIQGFWWATAIPEVMRLLAPDSLSNWTKKLEPYAPAGLTWGAAILGVFVATFIAWRNERQLIGLKARLRQIHCAPLMDGRTGTRVTIFVDIDNAGASPSAAYDWTLSVQRQPAIRSVERVFHKDDQTFDPQKVPLEAGAHIYGTITFDSGLSLSQLEKSQRRWRISFRDVAGHVLLVKSWSH
jgi:hypothetical protein